MRVSVILCVFNEEKFLQNAIESILNQSLSDFELIIVNDGSTDATLDIINSYDDERINLINQENIGHHFRPDDKSDGGQQDGCKNKVPEFSDEGKVIE